MMLGEMLEKEIEERKRGGSGRRVREEKTVLVKKGRAGQGGEGSERERKDLEKEWEK